MDALDEIKSDVKTALSKLGNVEVTLGKQQVILDEHVRRTALLEEGQVLVRKELEPLKAAVIARATLVKAGSVLVGCLTAGAALVEILHRLGLIHRVAP